MFDFLKIVTPLKLGHWIQNNQDALTKVDERYIGYKLEIARPAWFHENSQKKLYQLPIFTGKTCEEIFVKMFEYCLNNLRWKNGLAVNLCDYMQKLNDALLLDSIIEIVDGEYVVFDDEGNYMKITDDNYYLIEDKIFKWVLSDKIMLYGLVDPEILDCCFYAQPVKTV